MKTLIKFTGIAILALLFASCAEKPGEGSGSRIILDDAPVIVPAAGGTFSVAYQIKSPVEGGTVEAIHPEGWINSFDYSTDGIISFNVNENTGADREGVVTVIYSGDENPSSFTVRQANPQKVFASELENAFYTAEYCKFHRENTQYHEVDSDGAFVYDLDAGEYVVLSGGEFADAFAAAYNRANPDNLVTPDDVLRFDFGEDGDFKYAYNVSLYNGHITVNDIIEGTGGGAIGTAIDGDFTYDEETGIITVDDKSNTLFDRTVKIKVTRDGENILFQIIETMWGLPGSGNTLIDHLGTKDKFYLILYNYEQTHQYLIGGEIVYRLRYVEPIAPEA